MLNPSITTSPSISTMPTTLDLEVKLEFTDKLPFRLSWSLIDNDHDGAAVYLGPEENGTYAESTLYIFSFTLNRCNSYKFTLLIWLELD